MSDNFLVWQMSEERDDAPKNYNYTAVVCCTVRNSICLVVLSRVCDSQ